MKTLLQLNTSLFSARGQSTQLADRFVTAWRDQHPDAAVVVRDLAAEPVPHLDAARLQALSLEPSQRTPLQQTVVEESDRLVDELRRADVVVLGLPMYNLGMPSTLKAYFDHVARARVTFRYTEQGPEGLLKGKKVYVFATRGGQYAGTPLDSETRYVRDILAFLGMTEVEFVYAEGLALGDAPKQAALASAHGAIQQLIAGGVAHAA